MLCRSSSLQCARFGGATGSSAARRTLAPLYQSRRGLAAPPSDEAIAKKCVMRPINDVAAEKLAGVAGFDAAELENYGKYKAKVPLSMIADLESNPDGKLVLVTAMSPTKFGEGKTTTSVGLTDGLCMIGKNAMAALREPSLGPVFGMKGGAAGGGYAQVVPMADINLHFTGDLHAIGAANNLMAALLDNHIHHRKEPRIDVNRINWRRVVDMNDRALREIVVGLGGRLDGVPRQDGFDITVASEIMAVFCLAQDTKQLREMVDRIIVGYTPERKPVRAADLNAGGAVCAVLRDALQPNLVQTLEKNLALVHGGPFANIAHGCSSLIATKAALKMCDIVVTEAGFGADLGAEKFFNIKCRKSGLSPDVTVVVATIRALKLHGGADEKTLTQVEDVEAVKGGMPNLKRHVENMALFDTPVVVAINRFPTDTEAELAAVEEACAALGAKAIVCSHHGDGGAGAVELAKHVASIVEASPADKPLTLLYPDDMALEDKIRTVATTMYGASDIAVDSGAALKLRQFTQDGFGDLPVCMAKNQYSFSSDAKALGAPSGHVLPIRDVRLSAGAQFVVALCGSIMQMPGLPKVPAAESIGVDEKGEVYGLF